MELDPVYTGLKDMSATARAKRKSDADEQRRRTEASQAAPNITQTFAIVDGKGAVLQPPVQPVLPEATAAKILTTIKGTESVFFGMTEKQRSMEIWKKINPGCMESTLNLPTSTMHDHYIYEPEKLDTSLFDTTFHFKKTDFTEFCNKQVRTGGYRSNSRVTWFVLLFSVRLGTSTVLAKGAAPAGDCPPCIKRLTCKRHCHHTSNRRRRGLGSVR